MRRGRESLSETTCKSMMMMIMRGNDDDDRDLPEAALVLLFEQFPYEIQGKYFLLTKEKIK